MLFSFLVLQAKAEITVLCFLSYLNQAHTYARMSSMDISLFPKKYHRPSQIYVRGMRAAWDMVHVLGCKCTLLGSC